MAHYIWIIICLIQHISVMNEVPHKQIQYIIQIHNYSPVIPKWLPFNWSNIVAQFMCSINFDLKFEGNYRHTYIHLHRVFAMYFSSILDAWLTSNVCCFWFFRWPWTLTRQEMSTVVPTSLRVNPASGNTDISPSCKNRKRNVTLLEPTCTAPWSFAASGHQTLEKGEKKDWICPDQKPVGRRHAGHVFSALSVWSCMCRM